MVEQPVRNDILVKLSLAGPTEKPVCKEVATSDFATLINEAKQLAESQ